MKNIHISDIPSGATLEVIRTKDTLWPEISSREFLTRYRYKGKGVCWNDHNRPYFYERGDTATFSWSELKK